MSALTKKAVPEEKPSVATAPAVSVNTGMPAPASPSAPPVVKPLSGVQIRAIDKMRNTINEKVANGTISAEDAQLTLNALDGIKDADMMTQFLKVKGDFNL